MKRWRERDQKILFEQIKEKYLLFRRMRITVVRVDPGKKSKKATARKRSKKRNLKKQAPPQHRGGCRVGLRSTHGRGGASGNLAESQQADSLGNLNEEYKQGELITSVNQN